MEQIVLEAIGSWRTPIVEKEAAPKQGIKAGIIGELVLKPHWAEGLTGIGPGSYIWVFSFFDQAKEPKMLVHPRNDRSKHQTGLFNTRSPNRPVSLGMSLVEVLSIEGNRLSVKGVDALDGTPVLDIKPYSARLDSPQAV